MGGSFNPQRQGFCGSICRLLRQLLQPIQPIPFFIHPRKRSRYFDGLGGNLFAQDVLEHGAVDCFDLRHRMCGQDLIDAALVPQDVTPTTGIVATARAGSFRFVRLAFRELRFVDAHVRAVKRRWRKFRCEGRAGGVAIGEAVFVVLRVRRIERDRFDRDAGFIAQLFGVRLAHDGFEFATVAVGCFHRRFDRFDDPLGFAQEGGGIDGTGDDMQHPTIGSAEIAGDVTTLFGGADDLKRGDFLERRAKMFVDEFPDFGVG
jgi:hypothetical protein